MSLVVCLLNVILGGALGQEPIVDLAPQSDLVGNLAPGPVTVDPTSILDNFKCVDESGLDVLP